MVLLPPLTIVQSILLQDWTTPEYAEWIGAAWRILTAGGWRFARASLEVCVETLAAWSLRAPVCTLLDIVALHDAVAEVGSVKWDELNARRTCPM